MKLVHKSLTPWLPALRTLFTALAIAVIDQDAAGQSHTAHYNPSKGFKPAQANLTEIVLQMAECLEYHGSPEPYLRHIQKEHERVSLLYKQKTGKVHASRLPSHMTEAYVNKLIQNWNLLATSLGLNDFAKEIGRCTREGVMGTRLSGTLAVQIFNGHQKRVAEKMRGDLSASADFDDLKKRLRSELEFDKETINTGGYETIRRDAVSYALVIKDRFKRLESKIDASIKPEKAALIKEIVAGIFLDLGYMAQSELEIAILESALSMR